MNRFIVNPNIATEGNMKETALENLITLVCRRIGLFIRAEDYGVFGEKIQGRLNANKRLDLNEYCAMLENNTPQAKAEWNELVALLTTGESYFFRNKDQITLLKNRILPELIALRQTTRHLRIWSAGCSTGEEPYSLALLLDELLPPRTDWQVLILGTDINEKAIEKARKGIYTQWSFRMVASDLRDRYFTPHQDEWRILDSIRKRVTFNRCNLVEEIFPSWSGEMREMDLIICRNVFIYFAPETVSLVASKFADTLSDGGYLVTGHGELPMRNTAKLNTRISDDQLFFQKDSHHDLSATQKVEPTNDWRQISGSSPSKIPDSGVDNRRKKRVSLEQCKTVGIGVKLPPQRTIAGRSATVSGGIISDKTDTVLKNSAKKVDFNDLEECLELARACANSGDYEQAVRNCHKALKLSRASVEPYFLLAQIDETMGQADQAKESLKKVLYLDPFCIAAHLELGKIYLNDKDNKQARRFLGTAQELLASLPAGEPNAMYTGMTTVELLRHVEELLLVAEEQRP